MRAQNLGEGEGRRGRCPAPLRPSSPHLPPARPQRGLPHPTQKVPFVRLPARPPRPHVPRPSLPLHCHLLLPPCHTCPPPEPLPRHGPARSRLARLAASVWALPSAWSTISAASPSDPRLSNTTPPLCSPNPPYSHSTLYHTLDFIHSFIYTFVHSFIHFLHLSMFLLSLPCARHCDVHFSYIFSFRPFNDPESSIIII